LFDNPPANTTVGCQGIPIVPVLQAQDNCGPAQVAYQGQTQTPGDCSTGFVITRTWTATDLCGNVRLHTQRIAVSADMLNPPFSDRQAKMENDQLYYNFSLVPNPTFSTASILFGLREDTEILITVCDLDGRILYRKNYWASAGEHIYPLELEALRGGVYLVQMQAGQQREVEKLIVLVH
ncbi:MAG: T9SS type A sorting domain-containing protein, partial [Saprospiraceae bacterium]